MYLLLCCILRYLVPVRYRHWQMHFWSASLNINFSRWYKITYWYVQYGTYFIFRKENHLFYVRVRLHTCIYLLWYRYGTFLKVWCICTKGRLSFDINLIIFPENGHIIIMVGYVRLYFESLIADRWTVYYDVSDLIHYDISSFPHQSSIIAKVIQSWKTHIIHIYVEQVIFLKHDFLSS